MLSESEKEKMTEVGKLILPTGEIVLVDLDDLQVANQFKWHRKLGDGGNLYVQTCIKEPKQTTAYLSRILMKTPSGMQCDHIHGDGLDNRRSQLRNVTSAKNKQGFCRKKTGAPSMFRGVFLDKRIGRWVAEANKRVDGKIKRARAGSFATEGEAAVAYNFLAASLGFQKEAFNNINT